MATQTIKAAATILLCKTTRYWTLLWINILKQGVPVNKCGCWCNRRRVCFKLEFECDIFSSCGMRECCRTYWSNSGCGGKRQDIGNCLSVVTP